MSAPMESSAYTKMAHITSSISRFFALVCLLFAWNVAHLQAEEDFYSLSAIDIYGREIPFELFRGKVSL